MYAPLPAGIAAALALAFLVAVTGALHEDGLADVADAFRAGRSPERILAILKDSRIGAYGAVTLVSDAAAALAVHRTGRRVGAGGAVRGGSGVAGVDGGAGGGVATVRAKGSGRRSGRICERRTWCWRGSRRPACRSWGSVDRRGGAGGERASDRRGARVVPPAGGRDQRGLPRRDVPDFGDGDDGEFSMAIFLIRHQEPELRGRFIGQTDPPLTPAGREAAECLKRGAGGGVVLQPAATGAGDGVVRPRGADRGRPSSRRSRSASGRG